MKKRMMKPITRGIWLTLAIGCIVYCYNLREAYKNFYHPGLAVFDVTEFVRQNEGKWPGSKEELNSTFVNEGYIIIDYSTTLDELLRSPESLEEAVKMADPKADDYIFRSNLVQLKDVLLDAQALKAKDNRQFKARTSQMGGQLRDHFPEKPEELFQGAKVTVYFRIDRREDHLRAISKIPEKVLAGHRLTKTVEVDGWFYTSAIPMELEESPETDWFRVIGTKKGEKFIYFSHTW